MVPLTDIEKCSGALRQGDASEAQTPVSRPQVDVIYTFMPFLPFMQAPTNLVEIPLFSLYHLWALTMFFSSLSFVGI